MQRGKDRDRGVGGDERRMRGQEMTGQRQKDGEGGHSSGCLRVYVSGNSSISILMRTKCSCKDRKI